MSTTPQIKFEHSPVDSLADSFDSAGTQYESLFSDTMDPNDVMTPQSYNGDSIFGDSMDGSMAGTPAPEKKPVKKRKSWGQQLPEPKTNLPPRKRAKTEDEKEQRRVERVLRNRRAAQSSRERKRQEVEALENEKAAIERRNQDLEMRLANMEAQNILLQQQLEKLAGGNMTVFRGNSAASSPARSEQFRRQSTPVTFSQELFSSRDAPQRSINQQTIVDTQPSQTLNPASLSPEIKPVVESSNASSSVMTQHPAAMLCDLQCQTEEQRPWMDSTSAAISHILATILYLSMTLEVSSILLQPLTQIVTSLKTRSSLSPTTSILTLIIWLVTTTASLTNSTSMNTFTTTKATSPRPRFSLRIRLLNQLLACSPNLARPLMDATMAAMRLQSEQQLTRDCLTGVGACDRHGEDSSPSVEALMTLLWAIQVFEMKRERTPKLDAATEIRQACSELDGLFRHREIGERRGISFVTGMEGTLGQKSLDGWRTEFKHDRP